MSDNVYDEFLKSAIEKLKNPVNNLYKVLLEYAPSMVFIKDSENRILWCNKKALLLLGKDIDEVENKHIGEFFPAEVAKVEQHDKQVLETEEPMLDDISVINYNGKELLVRRDRIPYRDHVGNIKGVVVFVIDLQESVDCLKSYQDWVMYQQFRDGIAKVIKKLKEQEQKQAS